PVGQWLRARQTDALITWLVRTHGLCGGIPQNQPAIRSLDGLAGIAQGCLDEIVPAILPTTAFRLEAGDVEPVARPRHGDVEQPVSLLSLGGLNRGLCGLQRRKRA